LYFKGVYLKNFRNFSSLDLEFGPGINLLIGNNAQGKSNILEALYFPATLRPTRVSKEGELIERGERLAKIKAEGVSVREDTLWEVIFSLEERKKVKINNEEVGRLSLALGRFNVVMFSSPDREIIGGEPVRRRQFLDLEIPQTASTYYFYLRRYYKALGQRNYLLRERKNSLFPWDESIAENGWQVLKMRKEFVGRISPLTSSFYQAISGGERLDLTYLPSPPLPEGKGGKDYFLERLKESKRREQELGITQIGPQRDDLSFSVKGVDLKTYGSQGEKVSAALSLKLSQMELIKEEKGEYPVLLLDEVFSELDTQRQRFLSCLILEKDNLQVFITGNRLSSFEPDILKQAQVFRVEGGKAVKM